jgi:hypothetical protein
MNVFNRIVIVLLILIILILTVVIVIVPEQSFNILRAIFEWAQQDTKGYLSGPDHYLFLAARVIIGGAIVLVGLLVLWLELRRPRKKVIRVQKMAGGETNIAIESISQRVAYNIDQLPEVIKVTPRISGKSRGVDIDLQLETTPEIDVPMKTEEVLQVTKDVVEGRMGLKLGKVKINIKHAPYPAE